MLENNVNNLYDNNLDLVRAVCPSDRKVIRTWVGV